MMMSYLFSFILYNIKALYVQNCNACECERTQTQQTQIIPEITEDEG